MRSWLSATLSLLGTMLSVGVVSAHPHIFVDARATISFNAFGQLETIQNEWTFDEAFSVWQVQGLDIDDNGVTTPQEMQSLADENLAALADFGFYTSVGEGDQALELKPVGPASFSFSGNRSTLTFSVAPATPFLAPDRLEIGIADPAFYLGISFADASKLSFENLPPRCETQLLAGKPMADDVAAQLLSLGPDVFQLPPELAAKLRGSQQQIVISCHQ